ncbi:DUF4920 domain-containing protein [Flavobacterium endoglycinae]|uniref:DUF4920 domain-containing protein n=1 Tax=Flavobacterium endoglycinae TaxID=2816357 RepID=A0ABX7QHT5_9FLAO|nr:DUF4920 domain-containing protein [Flavobacterium endoglycinae]QSW90636.1 DUF4920 domain-containing protein [Flavobacterium endoglycinae]
MKLRVLLTVLFTCSSCFLFSQEDVEKPAPPAGNAVIGDFYGQDVSDDAIDRAVSVNQLEDALKKSSKIESVAVKGEVTDVCEKRGCWITVKSDDNSSFFVKMKDYAFFVPTALKGKNVVLEGKAERKITSVEELKHYAKDAKKTKSEIDAITKPKEEIRFMATGIKVTN